MLEFETNHDHRQKTPPTIAGDQPPSNTATLDQLIGRSMSIPAHYIPNPAYSELLDRLSVDPIGQPCWRSYLIDTLGEYANLWPAKVLDDPHGEEPDMALDPLALLLERRRVR